MAFFHKSLACVLFLLSCASLLAQHPEGTLFVLNEGSFSGKGTIGSLHYPEGTYTHIDSIAAYGNQIVLNGNTLVVVAGNGDVKVYDATTFALQATFAVAARQVTRYNAGQLLVASSQKPFFRAIDPATGNTLYSLDSTVIPTAREGMVINGDYAYVYGFNNDTLVYVVDLANQRLDTAIRTAPNNNWGAVVNGQVLIGCPDYSINKTILHTISGATITATDTLNEYLTYCGQSAAAIYLKAYGLPVVAYQPLTQTGDTLANTADSYTFMHHAPTGLGFFSQTDFATTGGVGYWWDGMASATVSTHISPRAFFFSGTLVTSTDAGTPDGGVVLYPNPTSDWLYLRATATPAPTWSLTDLAGKQVLSGTDAAIDCRNLPCGWYFLQIGAEGAVQTTRKVGVFR